MKASKPKDAVYTRIWSGDDWSKVYQPVLGVPDDGTEVEAPAFVLGEARVVEVRMSNSRTHEGRQVVFFDGVGHYPTDAVVEHIFGSLAVKGETRRYRIVPEPLPVPGEKPADAIEVRLPAEAFPVGTFVESERNARGWSVDSLAYLSHIDVEQLRRIIDGTESLDLELAGKLGAAFGTSAEYWFNLDLGYQIWSKRPVAVGPPEAKGADVAELEEPAVSEKPKVWLCCGSDRGEVGFGICTGPRPRISGQDFDISPGRWVEKGICAETASLIHPAHNLKPGECCEVPERETPVAPPVAEEGPRWVRPAFAEAFLMRYDDCDMWLGKEPCREKQRVVTWRATEDAEPSFVPVEFESKILTDDQDYKAHLAARERAWSLGLVAAPECAEGRWTAEQLDGTLTAFIGEFEEFDFHVGTNGCGQDCIWRLGEHGQREFTRLYPEPHYRTLNQFFELCHDHEARLLKSAYDTALAANQLPPHPRYPRPEGATDFLGWDDTGSMDLWWGVEDGNRGVFIAHADGGSFWRQGLNPDYDSFQTRADANRKALARARELGLPERDARKARRAELTRQIAEMTAERDGLEVPSA